MIIFPSIKVTALIEGNKCCRIQGSPDQIVEQVLCEITRVDDDISIIAPKCKDIYLFNNGDVGFAVFNQALQNHGITVKEFVNAELNEIFNNKQTK